MKYILLIAISIGLLSCTGNSTEELYNSFKGKQFVFPSKTVWTCLGKDTIPIKNDKQLKVLYYIDSSGCLSCKAQLSLWKDFTDTIGHISNGAVPVKIFISPKELANALAILNRAFYPYPVCIDPRDSLNALNHFPADERFHCFLLDEDNRVLLIGNPVQSPKIKELYIRTICERLGIESQESGKESQEAEASDSHDFGKFPYSETKETEFLLSNKSEPKMLIDTIFTSCGCTTAQIDKTAIEPGSSARITVRYKADKPETFMREVCVKLGSETRVFTIRGEAI